MIVIGQRLLFIRAQANSRELIVAQVVDGDDHFTG